MNIALVCLAGMSTSMLVANMKKFATADDTIVAMPASELKPLINDYDVVLVGPQLRYQLKEIEALATSAGKKAALIDMRIYGAMNGKAALEQARGL